VEATEEALAAGLLQIWSLNLWEYHMSCHWREDGGANRLGEDNGGGARPLKEVVVRCHGADFRAEMLDLALACHPYTSLSTLQAM
jgi:hypothetical protein